MALYHGTAHVARAVTSIYIVRQDVQKHLRPCWVPKRGPGDGLAPLRRHHAPVVEVHEVGGSILRRRPRLLQQVSLKEDIAP